LEDSFIWVREYNFSNVSDLQIAAAKDNNKQVRHKIEARETERDGNRLRWQHSKIKQTCGI